MDDDEGLLHLVGEIRGVDTKAPERIGDEAGVGAKDFIDRQRTRARRPWRMRLVAQAAPQDHLRHRNCTRKPKPTEPQAGGEDHTSLPRAMIVSLRSGIIACTSAVNATR